MLLTKKLRIFLEPGVPLYFVPGNGAKPDPKCSLTLTKFKMDENRVEWEIRQGDGQIIVGRVKQEQPLRLFNADGCWISLAVPITVHLSSKGAMRPDFMVTIPSLYTHSTGK